MRRSLRPADDEYTRRELDAYLQGRVGGEQHKAAAYRAPIEDISHVRLSTDLPNLHSQSRAHARKRTKREVQLSPFNFTVVRPVHVDSVGKIILGNPQLLSELSYCRAHSNVLSLVLHGAEPYGSAPCASTQIEIG